MSHCHNYESEYSRRDFFRRTSLGLGAFTIASLLDPGMIARNTVDKIAGMAPHFTPKANRIIYLFQSGAPSQLDLFDYKPLLNKRNGEEIPASILGKQRLTGMSSGQIYAL